MKKAGTLLVLLAVALLVSPARAPEAAGATPAARVQDMHTCPLVNADGSPHVGGPVLSGSPDVLIGGKPAARVGDPASCNGPLDSIVQGSATVLIDGLPAAYQGSATAHGGSITLGEATVLIGN